jgi:Cu/Ag efflux protein CusF
MTKTSLSELCPQLFNLRVLRTSLLTIVMFTACNSRPPIVEKTVTPAPTPPASVATGPQGYPSPILDHPYPATGVVTIINKKEGWIEINHDDIVGLMPAMQMEFWVKDKSLLDRVKVGDKVDFVVIETTKGEYLTDIKKKE